MQVGGEERGTREKGCRLTYNGSETFLRSGARDPSTSDKLGLSSASVAKGLEALEALEGALGGDDIIIIIFIAGKG